MNITKRQEPLIETPSGLEQAIGQVWNSIAPDTADTGDEPLTNVVCIEACLDADRLHTFANAPTLNAWVAEIASQGKFQQLVQQLAQDIHLV